MYCVLISCKRLRPVATLQTRAQLHPHSQSLELLQVADLYKLLRAPLGLAPRRDLIVLPLHHMAARHRQHSTSTMVDSSSTNIDYNVQHYQLQPTESWPSNAALPILHYIPTIPMPYDDDESLAEHFEHLLPQHQWQPQWRFAMFKQHHYHSTVHECLCIFSGQAHVQLGSEDQNTGLDYESPHTKNLVVKRGEVVVLPVGTGHHLVSSKGGFSMVGCYPNNAPHCDMNHLKDSTKSMDRIQRRIQAVPLPTTDPLQGKDGAMSKLWHL